MSEPQALPNGSGPAVPSHEKGAGDEGRGTGDRGVARSSPAAPPPTSSAPTSARDSARFTLHNARAADDGAQPACSASPVPRPTSPGGEAAVENVFSDPEKAALLYKLGAPVDPREGVLDPPPLWQQVAGFKGAKAVSLSQRRSGLKRLVLWVTNWLSAVAAEHAGKPVDPGWEPARELAEALELPEPQLNRLCREQGGPSAREIWDRLRAEGFVAALRGEIERMLAGRKFRKSGVDRTPLEVMQTALRSARRDEGWTRVEFAWSLGFRNHARLNLAIFRALGQSVQRIEAQILKDIASTWYISHSLCVILREEPSEAELEAMREASIPIFRSSRKDPKDSSPQPYTSGCSHLIPLLPKIPAGTRQYETVNERNDRVRVFADQEEVRKYFLAAGRDEAWMISECACDQTLDDFLEMYVIHGMVIRDDMTPDIVVPD